MASDKGKAGERGLHEGGEGSEEVATGSEKFYSPISRPESARDSLMRRHLTARSALETSCKNALRGMPSRRDLRGHWNNTASVLLLQIRRILEEGSRADSDDWDSHRCSYFITTIDVLLQALDVGWDMGFRDATGVTVQRSAGLATSRPKQDNPTDPYGCGPAPYYPEGASCTLKCSMERDWCLCRTGCGVDVDCGSFPCTECFECNLNHAACVLDCIFVVPPPDPGFLNPASLEAFLSRGGARD
jgi:hypothetical protein